MSKSKRLFWTVQESKLLRKLYADASWPEILAAFPRMSQHQIIIKAHSLKLHRKNRSKVPWTPEEDKILTNEFYTAPVKELKKRLGRPGVSIYAHARRLGMKRRADADAHADISVKEHHRRMVKKYFGITL